MPLIQNIFSIRTGKIFIWIFLFNIVSFNTTAQISSEKLKATLILHLCENVTWRSELPETLKIACVRADNNLYKFLKPAEKNIRIQQKHIAIERINDINNLQGFHSIYYGGNEMDELVKLFNYAKENNILLITNNIEDELFVLINLKDLEGKVTFNVNMPNLTLAGFSVKPNLLLNGGSVVDINAAYEKFEERLQNSKDRLDDNEKALEITKSKLREKDSLLKEKELTLKQYLKDINVSELKSNSLKKSLEEEKNLIELQRIELKKSQREFIELQNEIRSEETEFKRLEENQKALQNKSDNLQNEISEKNAILSEQEILISSQRKMLFMSIFLAVALIITGITLYRLFTLKKRNNLLLAKKVEERTKELQLSNKHFQTLFNLAPVALWETDFSEVKKYIDSHGFKSEEDYNKYVLTNDDFSIECVRRINFKKINQTALDLYKIESKDELIDIYEQIYASGELKGLIPEFKLIFLEKASHTFESVRRNKLGENIEMIVTWVDISETPGTFRRVLLSLVDITHLRQIEKELKKHKNELELLVKEKTEDIEAANEELKSTNEELYEKNNIINDQNTELKATLQHLKETQTQLLQSEKMASLGILTAGVAHEINNPLNYIMGAYEGLKVLNKNTGNEKILSLLNALKVGLDKAANIVKSLNQFSRENHSANEECNIHEIIDNSLVMLQNRLKNRIEVIKEFTSDYVIISGNIGSIHQVFLNILSNAEQAIGEEGKIVIKTKKNKEKVFIEISDTGHGISEENLNKITDPFFTTKDPGKGTGLGLSITYNLIKEHNGMLEFESEINKGTIARIVLPVKGNK